MKSFFLSIANLFRIRSWKPRGNDSTTVPAATTREAVRNNHLRKSGQKEDVRKDDPSAIKTVTDQLIRQTSRHEPLFSVKSKKLHKKRPKEDVRKDNPSTIKTVTDQPIKQTTWHERFIEKTKKLFKRRPKEDVRKDGPSAIKTVPDQAIRQTTWHERFIEKTKKLFKKRPKEDVRKDGPSAIKSVTHKPIRQTSMHEPLRTRNTKKLVKKRPKEDVRKDGPSTIKSVTHKPIRQTSMHEPLRTGKTKKLKKRPKDDVRKDGPSIIKSVTHKPIRQTSRHERLVSKPVEKKTLPRTVDKGRSFASQKKDDSTTVPAATTREAVRNNHLRKSGRKEDVRKDVTSTIKSVTDQRIRQTSRLQPLFSQPVENKTLPEIVDKGRSFISFKRSHVFARSPSSDSINDLDCEENLGFPNPSQICYMNSILQSLLTLTEFIGDIRVQKDMWELAPGAEFLSAFMDIVRCHRSPNKGNKLQALFAFKMEVGKRCAEFLDMGQKDAHELLTTFLDYVERLHPVITGRPGMADLYICPIQKHLMFKMTNTRACKKCGQGSINEEVFNNLSLNLVPQESVKEMLDHYLLKTEFECKCVCGGANSTQCYSFDTLPRILILHVKRFCFTPFYTLKKLIDPINISRELIISSTQGQGQYSLVSVVNHIGSNGNSGHYVSAGVKRDAAEDDPTDQWVMYNDNYVKRTTGQSTCNQYKKDAYILFYKRQE
ncbi:ubiquitin carboxyl-terminal hydrolase 37-like isoform X3 [Paralichthys olivaceus]|uniref:ubiquitin carboxyl-terminal hydrolase 37-like isoform X3 n=1 Tax=Paralichthys olivaceus TaxID=8255 RepID=UPI0037523164